MRTTTMLVVALSLGGATLGARGTEARPVPAGRRVAVTCCLALSPPVVPAPVCGPVVLNVKRRYRRIACPLIGGHRLPVGGSCAATCAPTARS